jgi:spermidine/putrescine transport system ATP-binding protein
MSDRIAVMNRGVIEQLATPEDVYERPRTEFVAGFIGVSNLLPGEVESVNGGLVDLRLDSGPTVRTRGAGVQRGDRCHAVVRPEKLTVAKVENPAPAGLPSVDGVVESAVFLGTATQMIVKLAGDVRLTVLVPNADEAQRQSLPGAGARVRLSWAPENMHVVSGNGASPDVALQNAQSHETAGATV